MKNKWKTKKPPDKQIVNTSRSDILKRRGKQQKHTVVQGFNTWMANINHPRNARTVDDFSREPESSPVKPIDVPALREILMVKIDAINRIGVLASFLMHLFILAQCELKRFDTEVNQSICSSACRLVSGSKGVGSQALGEVFNTHFTQVGFPLVAITNCGNCIDALGMQMATNFNTYLDHALADHVVYYIRKTYGLSKASAGYAWATLEDNGRYDGQREAMRIKRIEEKDPKNKLALIEQIKETEASIRKAITDLSGERTKIAWLHHILLLTNKHNVDHPDASPLKLFTMFPRRRIGHGFVTFDKKMFAAKEYRDLNFHRILRAAMPPRELNRLRRSNVGYALEESPVPPYEEACSFSTDGYRVCVTYATPRKRGTVTTTLKDARIKHYCLRKKETVLDYLPERGIVYLEDLDPELLRGKAFECFDPGHKSLFTGNDRSTMTLREWRGIICRKRVQKQVAKRALSLKDVADRLPSLKMSCTGEVVESLRVYRVHWDRLWTHYTQKYYGRSRFQQARLRHRALDLAVSRLVGKDTRYKFKDKVKMGCTRRSTPQIAVIGSAMFSGSPKSIGSVPVVAVKEHAGRKGLVILIDEYMSSQKCSSCCEEAVMVKPQRRGPAWRCKCGHRFAQGERACPVDGKVRPQILRDLYGLFTCKKCDRTWDRDENASLNLCNAYESYLVDRSRPRYLQRKDESLRWQ